MTGFVLGTIVSPRFGPILLDEGHQGTYNTIGTITDLLRCAAETVRW